MEADFEISFSYGVCFVRLFHSLFVLGFNFYFNIFSIFQF
jgi:hypothetical protein